MGEANYYMRVHFSTAEAAAEALPKIKDFLIELGRTENDWQSNRHYNGKLKPADDPNEPRQRFFAIGERHKDVFDSLGLWPLYDAEVEKYQTHNPDTNSDYSLNCLAGEVDSPAHIWTKEGEAEEISLNIEQKDNEVRFMGEVWHFANWDRLKAVMTAKFGAEKANWLSDEYAEIDYYDML